MCSRTPDGERDALENLSMGKERRKTEIPFRETEVLVR